MKNSYFKGEFIEDGFWALRLLLNRLDKETHCAGIDEKYMELETKENRKNGGKNEKECFSCFRRT